MDLELGRTLRVEDEEAPSIFRKETDRPVTLKFVEVKYLIKPNKTKNRCSIWPASSTNVPDRLILKGISGVVYPGEMLAMLGPSGSGKTTLLTALGGRLHGHLSGSVTYNDMPFSKSMTRNTGFVTQDDDLYPHLTVTETLVYTARLRLPRKISKEEKVGLAMAVISLLGLTHCKDSIIGGGLVRGISGGERKRVSIGQEMLINPSLLFLDEPTSGLDSTTAQKIVSTLEELAAGGRTIIMTIHQPSSRIFYMFHKVLLLSDGYPIYFGKGSDTMDYFEGVGQSPGVPMNPADFLLDLANGISSVESQSDRTEVKGLLVSAYQDNIGNELNNELSVVVESGMIATKDQKEISRWSATWREEFIVLLQRGMKEGKHSSFSGLRISQILFVTFFTGFLWWQSDSSHIQDQTGILFFYTTFWVLLPMFQAIFTFPQERKMLTKERSSGMYRLSSYFMAKTCSDLPMELVLPTVFITISYWMAGLKPTFPNFFQTLFVILLTVVVGQGMGLSLGALIMDQKAATTLGSICSLTFLLSAGYYVQHVPVFVSWVKYISITHYTYLLLLDSQFAIDDTYLCGKQEYCLVRDFPTIKLVGLGHVGTSLMALLMMLVGFRLIAYVALTRIGAKS
ncbi:ABC transporter G family member 9-like [Aristolochia californica]|uniref:ABC transporter G family member 9-like n=1 Tax=Aristolochia californica TaxID=171875 RepID=UPI0035E0B292